MLPQKYRNVLAVLAVLNLLLFLMGLATDNSTLIAIWFYSYPVALLWGVDKLLSTRG